MWKHSLISSAPSSPFTGGGRIWLERRGGWLSFSLGDNTPRALGPTRVRAFVIWVLAELPFERGARMKMRRAR